MFGLFNAEEKEFTEKTAILTSKSNEDGIFNFENVPYGEYIVRELKPAEGYLPNEENYRATVLEDEEVIEITVENDKIPELGTTATIDGKRKSEQQKCLLLKMLSHTSTLYTARSTRLRAFLWIRQQEKSC